MQNYIGTVVWNELQTQEVVIMKNFYEALFGYDWHKVPLDDHIAYNIAMVNNVGSMGLVQLPRIVADAGGQSFHIYYIAVDNLEETREKAVSLGGHIVVNEIMMENMGRWCILVDPFGAAFCIIEVQGMSINPRAKEQGRYWHHEVIAKDVKDSALFYGQLFGWKIERVETDSQTYYRAKDKNDVDIHIHFMPMDERLKVANINDFWLGFIYCDHVDALCETAIQKGATILLDPTDVASIGRYAWLSMPDHSILGLVTPMADI
ncbi:MAG: VOC family protein [Alphaproteobacteria bacterium]